MSTDSPAAPRPADEPHGLSRPAAHHAIPYFLIFYCLVALTAVTVLVARKRFDNEVANVSLALLVASIKATLVARFFMHLKFEGKLIWLILVVPLFLTVVLVCALIPDVVLTRPQSHSASLHLFTDAARAFDRPTP